MTFRKKVIMVSNNRFDNQNEYSISDITNKIHTLEGKVNSGGSGNSSGDSLPVGTITFFGSATVPTGYLICNGVAVSRTAFSNLFSVIGTSFGSGDDKNTFNLPNLLGKFIEGSETVGTSKPNNIYGSSDTVQPSSVTLLPCIKAYSSVTNTSDVDVSAFLNTVTNLPANYLSLGDQTISDTQLKSVSDKLRLSSSCFPSTVYDELTQVNLTAYTAPADGWFVFSGVMSSVNNYISLINTVTGLRHLCAATPAGAFLCVYMMARKGESVFLDHSPYTTAKVSKFCYNNPADKE